MKKIMLAIALVLITTLSSVAQCDKKVKWQASKAELLDESGQVVDNKTGTITITADAKTVTIEIAENANDKLEGTVNETSCNWKEAYKNGKSTLKTTMMDTRGDTSPATLTIEGKEGKLTIVVELEKMNGKKVLIQVDKYEES